MLADLPGNQGRSRIGGLLILLLPVALGAGLALRFSRPAPWPLAVQLDREQFIARARSAAHYAGLETANWPLSLNVEQNQARARQYAGQPSSARQVRLAPALTVVVHQNEPDFGNQVFETRFSPAGDLLSWSASESTSIPASKQPPDVAVSQAKAAVEAWVKTFDAAAFVEWQPDARAGADSDLYGRVRFSQEPKAVVRVTARLTRGRMQSASLSDDSAGEPKTGSVGGIEEGISQCGFLLINLFVWYSWRLARMRRREGELPLQRALVLAAAFGLCGVLLVALNIEVVSWGGRLAWGQQFKGYLPVALALLSGLGKSLLLAVGGLLVSAAYAGGEGEIREGWPGKLLGFDALLAGKWFTKPVGEAAVVAAVVAGWVFFLSSLAWYLSSPRAAILVDSELVGLALGRQVMIRSLAGLPLRVSFLIVAGVFMPLAFVHRRRWLGWKQWTFLVLCPLLVDLSARSFGFSSIGGAATLLGTVAVLWIPFYRSGLLAACLGMFLFSSLSSMSAMAAAVPAVSWPAALLVAGILLAMVPLLAAAWRGADVTEEAVRPQYARNLAVRLSMRAEVTAAREAQLRLLPAKLPERADVTVAAYCQPAGVVGGDFYDFITAPDGRLCVFVASGSGSGLASALTIALAKGFLWPEVKRGESPASALGHLVEALSGRLGTAAERTGLLLASVDPRGATLELARRGKCPAVWLLHDRMCRPVDIEGPGPVNCTSLPWGDGSVVLIHTEGLTSLLDDQSATGQRRWLDVTAKRTQGVDAAAVELDLITRLGGRKRKRLRHLHQDLTMVVLAPK